ncbi:hypothetical protein ABW19_dt0209911 [Dactylella cylindrospora]|nr:hypothetical protein ABW19_dt0209911 [Dactylella cylindrospora]
MLRRQIVSQVSRISRQFSESQSLSQLSISLVRRYTTMTSDQGIPVFTVGKSVDIGRKVKEGLLPDYDIIHMVTSAESLKVDLPKILQGEKVIPSTSIGSNQDRPADAQRLPKLIAVGGGFSPEDFQAMKDSVDLTAGGVVAPEDVATWVKIGPKSPGQAPLVLPPGQLPSAEFVIKNSKAALDEVREEKGL